jgi:hypothetical protein
MNARVTIPSFPSPETTDLKTVIRKLNDIILLLYTRDSERERRIQELERKLDRGGGSSKYSLERFFGTHFKAVESFDINGKPQLELFYSSDGKTFQAESIHGWYPESTIYL